MINKKRMKVAEKRRIAANHRVHQKREVRKIKYKDFKEFNNLNLIIFRMLSS